MVEFKRFELDNGLKVIVHEDYSTPIVAVNTLYDVGARDEHPEKTGFAHLFEHLMFGGSKHIPSYDEPLQRAGGENNAFTSNDLTNYYITLPRQNVETAFWLESDRMLELAFTPKSLEVQRSVVIEEFKQRYLNQPYGDVWLHLRPLAYTTHPYRWPTIGKEIGHIEQATMDDVKAFFYRYYRPNNAILSVAGAISVDEVKELTEKWFGPIPAGEKHQRSLPQEPEQVEFRSLTLHRAVPADALYIAFHMCDRLHSDYYALDLLSDVFSRGASSRLYQKLVKSRRLFTEIQAYISGDRDAGLFVISGKLMPGIEMKEAEAAVWEEIQLVQSEQIKPNELTKVKNKVEATIKFSTINVLDKAMGLAIAELIQDADLLNNEFEFYTRVKEEDVKHVANRYLQRNNCVTLYYLKKE
jgi:predicted Zn-dependent peptidase